MNLKQFCAKRTNYLVGLGVLSCALAALSIIADGYRAGNSIAALVPLYGSVAGAVITGAQQALLIFAIGFGLGYLWERGGRAGAGDGTRTGAGHGAHARAATDGPRPWNVRLALAAAGVIFVAWLPWIATHAPGTMRDDTFPQALQWFGIYPYYTQHPVTDTVIFGLFWSLGDLLGSRGLGLLCYIVVQAAVTSLLFGAVAACLDRVGAPRLLIVLAIVYYAFSRVIYQPVNTMSKDALNGMAFVAFCVLFFEAVRSDFARLCSWRFCAALCVSIVLCAVTKRTMLYVIVLAVAATIVVRLVQRRPVRRLVLSVGASVVIALGVWNPLANAAVGAEANPTYEMYSVPVQQIARTLREHPDALDASDRERLEDFLDVERACEVYNPWRSDEATWCVVNASRFPACADIWLKLGLEYPGSYAAAVMNLTANWFSLNATIDYGHDAQAELFTPERMDAWESFFSSRAELESFVETLDLTQPESLAGARAALERLDAAQRSLAPISSYALWCTVLPLVTLVYCLYCVRGRGAVVACVSLLAVSAALLVSFLVGPIALYWYTIPSVYIVPLVVAVPFAARGAGSEDGLGKQVG